MDVLNFMRLREIVIVLENGVEIFVDGRSE